MVVSVQALVANWTNAALQQENVNSCKPLLCEMRAQHHSRDIEAVGEFDVTRLI